MSSADELYPRHMKALRDAARQADHTAKRQGATPIPHLKEAMKIVREIAAQQRLSRKYRPF